MFNKKRFMFVIYVLFIGCAFNTAQGGGGNPLSPDEQDQQIQQLRQRVARAYPDGTPSFFFLYAWEAPTVEEDYCYRMIKDLNEVGIHATSAAHSNLEQNIHEFFQIYSGPETLRLHGGHHVVLACSDAMMRKYNDQSAPQAHVIRDEIHYFIGLRNLRDRDLLSRAVLIRLDGHVDLNTIHSKLAGDPFAGIFTCNNNTARAPIGSVEYYEALENLCLYRHRVDKAPTFSFSDVSSSQRHNAPPPAAMPDTLGSLHRHDDQPGDRSGASETDYVERFQNLLKRYRQERS